MFVDFFDIYSSFPDYHQRTVYCKGGDVMDNVKQTRKNVQAK